MKSIRALILSLFLILTPAGLAYADGGSLYLTPAAASYSVGDTFAVQVFANSGGVAINAAEADLTFDPTVLNVQSIAIDGSILSSWPTQPSFSNDNGTVTFSGVAAQKYTGSAGLLVTITFKALQNMEGDVHFESGAILAADGVESNVITTMTPGTYSIAPVESAAPAPDGSSNSGNGSASPASDSSNTASSSTASDVAPPVIINYQSSISTGNRIIVQGSAPPDATISVYLKQGGNSPLRTDLNADDNGSFTYTSDTQEQAGVYQLWAVTQGPGGTQSVHSNKVDITAIPQGAASVALVTASISTNLIPFTALIVFFGLAVLYLFHRHKLEKYKIEMQSKAGGTS
jgi:hypothetical protein